MVIVVGEYMWTKFIPPTDAARLRKLEAAARREARRVATLRRQLDPDVQRRARARRVRRLFREGRLNCLAAARKETP
jgi:hypothetical protein